MKVIKLHRLILCFTFLIALFISCTSQNPSNQQTQQIQVSNNTQSLESETDTLLKFTSGIRSILEDSKGNIWFGSHQEGAAVFDGEKLSYFKVKDGLSDNQIRSIYEDSNGNVWFEGGRGISSFDGKKIITHSNKNYDSKDEWQTNQTDLWFKGDEVINYNIREAEPGVYRYDGKELTYHKFPIAPQTPLIESQNNHSYYSVSTPFVRGKNGRLWFGTYGAVFGFDGSSFTIIDSESLGLNEATGFLHVRSIFEDSKGNLWIGNNGIGVLLHDGDSTINFSEAQDVMSPLSLRTGGYRSPAGSLEHVFAIGEDSDGNIWFGDRDTGAWRYDGQSLKNYAVEDGLTSTHIWQIYHSKKGELWLAMGDGNILKFNGKSFDRIF